MHIQLRFDVCQVKYVCRQGAMPLHESEFAKIIAKLSDVGRIRTLANVTQSRTV